MKAFHAAVLFAATLLSFSACKKGKDTHKEPDTSFTGVWNVDSIRSTTWTDSTITEDSTEVLAKGQLRISFNEDNTYSWVNTGAVPYRDSGSYERDSAKVLLNTVVPGGHRAPATYTISGSKMVLFFTHQGGTTYKFDDLLYMNKE